MNDFEIAKELEKIVDQAETESSLAPILLMLIGAMIQKKGGDDFAMYIIFKMSSLINETLLERLEKRCF